MTEWGPGIEVNGVRPEWLRDEDVDLVMVKGICCGWFIHDTKCPLLWNNITHIRLPSDHPYYSKDDVPDWAKVKAFRLGYPNDEISDAAVLVNYDASSVAVKELARYIAKHEQPPMDEVDRFMSEDGGWGASEVFAIRAFLKWQKAQP